MDQIKIGKFIAECRKNKDLTQAQLAEKLNVTDAMEQAERDLKTKKEKRIPIVFHRKNRKPWLATAKFEDWVKFYKSWLKDKDREE